MTSERHSLWSCESGIASHTGTETLDDELDEAAEIKAVQVLLSAAATVCLGVGV